MNEADLPRAHKKVREILLHHDIGRVHTALVADLIYAVEDIVVESFNQTRQANPECLHFVEGFKAGRAALRQWPEQSEPHTGLVRFCPECGSVGEVKAPARDCCPDGSHAAYMPEKTANLCRALFVDALSADSKSQTVEAADPRHP